MSDRAERLHRLIETLKEKLNDFRLISPTNNRETALSSVPLWAAMQPLAQHIGLRDDRELRDSFEALCDAVLRDVKVVPLRKESVRANWEHCVSTLSNTFSAPNFPTLTGDVFAAYFGQRTLEVLDAISERMQAADIVETTDDELHEALAAVESAIEALNRSGELDARIVAVLAHYLQQMKTLYSQSKLFGDELFWKVYKETLATFVQIQPVIAGLSNADEIKSRMQVVREKLTPKMIVGVAVAANLATLGEALKPLLTGW